jgi:membrane-associated protein
MELLQQFIHFFTHLPEHLEGFIRDYGAWTYGILFAIIFAETGLVFAPFLPGDSLLFAVGALSARGSFDVWIVSAVLLIAAVLGDAVNYHVGKYLGPRMARGQRFRLIKPKHLERTHEFFEKYGGKTIILARFVPIVRTFAPFVAGMGAMSYGKFVLYNIVGAAAWVAICVGAGYFFGNFEVVKKNFELVIVGIIFVSILPMVVEYMLARRRKARADALAAGSQQSAG